jgi:pimeloyl-ACP methyl ester carboxylesterase
MADAEVNGVRLSYDVQGSGPPLVLVCGTGQRADSWALMGTVAEAVEDGYQVVTFDNRGMPPSDAPEGPYTVEQMADDTVGLIEHLGLRDVRVAGISLGGFITFEVAHRRPDLVKGAVCIAGLVGGSSYAKLFIRDWLEALAEGFEMPPRLGLTLGLPALMAPATIQDGAFVDMIAALPPGTLMDWRGPGRVGQYQADDEWIARSSEWQEQALRETTVPVLVIAHEFDVIHTPALLRWGAERLPAGRYLEIAGCAHGGTEGLPARRDAMNTFFAAL